MKWILAVFLVLVLLPLSACHTQDMESSSVSLVISGEERYYIDHNTQTITHNDDTYRFQISDSKLELFYPNGATYYTTFSKGEHMNAITRGWSEHYDESRYVPGDVLADLITVQPEREGGGLALPGLLIFAIGAFNTIWPRASWYLSYGWRFQDAEPSDMALDVNRIIGVCAAIAGIFMMFA